MHMEVWSNLFWLLLYPRNLKQKWQHIDRVRISGYHLGIGFKYARFVVLVLLLVEPLISSYEVGS